MSLYSVGERIFRTTVFQISVAKGSIEHAVLWIYNAILQRSLHPLVFDEQRCERTRETWKYLGAEFYHVTPRDELASIQVMHVKSADIEKKIEALGGEWKKVILLRGKAVFAIFPPLVKTAEWVELEGHLQNLRWKEEAVTLENGQECQAIVTCKHARHISDEDCHKNVFMHVNSASVSFIMLKKRAGFYLGCKQNICFYDPRGSWDSRGVASEGGFYNDAMAVYNSIKNRYSTVNTWISSACGGGGAAGFLVSKLHETGVNFIRENGFTKLKEDFVDSESWLAKKLAYLQWSGLASRDIPEDLKPKETGFNVKELCKDLPKTEYGKVIIVAPSNDQLLGPDVHRKHVKRAQRIFEKVYPLTFVSRGPDAHSERYYDNHGKTTSKVLKIIFS